MFSIKQQLKSGIILYFRLRRAKNISNFFGACEAKNYVCSRVSPNLIAMCAEHLYQCRNWILFCSRAGLRQIWIDFTMPTECLYQCQKRILICSGASKNIPSTIRKHLDNILIQSLAPQAKFLRFCSPKSCVSLLFQALKWWENTRKH